MCLRGERPWTAMVRRTAMVRNRTALLTRYADVPMSLADACLVRMSEQYSASVVLTCDSDFQRYRRHRRQRIPTIMPDARS